MQCATHLMFPVIHQHGQTDGSIVTMVFCCIRVRQDLGEVKEEKEKRSELDDRYV